MSKSFLRLLELIALSALMMGCNRLHPIPEAVMYETTDCKKWSEMWPAVLQFPGDTVPASIAGSQVKADIWVRYNLEAPQSVTLVITHESLTGSEKTDTVSLSLFTPGGKPEGRGTYGLYEVHRQLPAAITASPGLTFRIWPVVSVNGITDTGISFTKL